MNNLKMIAELESNCKANFSQLCELFKAYDLAKLGYDMQREQEKECYNAVLAENVFTASKKYTRGGISTPETVTNESDLFLLSDEDFERVQKLAAPKLVAAGITDERGYYTTDWLGIKGDTRRALVDFIINKILPEAFKAQFEAVKLNIVQTGKLLDTIRPIVQKAA